MPLKTKGSINRMNTLLKKSWPHLAAMMVFLLLSIAFFQPQLSGKLVQQSDIMQYLGMAKEANDYEKKTGEPALWTNSMFGGMPTYQINTVSAGNNLTVLEKAGRLFIAEPIGQFLLAMLSFYILMIVIGADPLVAAIGAVAFGFTTNNFILYEAGHITKLKSISFFPLIAAGALMAFRGRYLLGGLLFAVGLGLNIYSNHIQMTYYLALTFLFFGVAQLVYNIKDGKMLHFAKAAGVLLLGVGPCAGFHGIQPDDDLRVLEGYHARQAHPDAGKQRRSRNFQQCHRRFSLGLCHAMEQRWIGCNGRIYTRYCRGWIARKSRQEF
jgi:hypothetical protein